jgi:hypothetical protein
MTESLLTDIDRALAELADVERAGEEGPDVLTTLRRQLNWCRAFVATGLEPERRPGPFSMGLIATRQFDMYGARPALASLINDVQSAVERRLHSEPPFNER